MSEQRPSNPKIGYQHPPGAESQENKTMVETTLTWNSPEVALPKEDSMVLVTVVPSRINTSGSGPFVHSSYYGESGSGEGGFWEEDEMNRRMENAYWRVAYWAYYPEPVTDGV